jgi:hypothetical protein
MLQANAPTFHYIYGMWRLVLLLLFPVALHAQRYRDQGRQHVGHNFVITLAGHQNKAYTTGELAIGRAYSETNGAGGSYYQYGLGSEFLWRNGDSLVLAPKLYGELAINMLGLRVNLLNYTDLQHGNSLKFRPEIGLTAVGYVNIYYGYTIAITNKDFIHGTHTLSVQWNIFCGGRYFNTDK